MNISDLPIVEIGGNTYRKTTVGDYANIADRASKSDGFSLFHLLKFFIGPELVNVLWLAARVVNHVTEYYYGHPNGRSIRVQPDVLVYIYEPQVPESIDLEVEGAVVIRSHLDDPVTEFLGMEIAANMPAFDAVTLQKNAAQSLTAYKALKKETDRANREADRCIILQAQIDGLTHELTELRAKDAEADDYLCRVMIYTASQAVHMAQNSNGWINPLSNGRHPTKEAAIEGYITCVRRAVQKR